MAVIAVIAKPMNFGISPESKSCFPHHTGRMNL
jgi:hypothetical protein